MIRFDFPRRLPTLFTGLLLLAAAASCRTGGALVSTDAATTPAMSVVQSPDAFTVRADAFATDSVQAVRVAHRRGVEQLLLVVDETLERELRALERAGGEAPGEGQGGGEPASAEDLRQARWERARLLAALASEETGAEGVAASSTSTSPWTVVSRGVEPGASEGIVRGVVMLNMRTRALAERIGQHPTLSRLIGESALVRQWRASGAADTSSPS